MLGRCCGMRHDRFLMEKIQNLWEVATYIYGVEEELESFSGYELAGPSAAMVLTLKHLCQKTGFPMMVDLNENIYYWGFLTIDGELVTFGPVSHMPLTEEQLRAFRHEAHIKDASYRVPAMSVIASVEILGLLMAMVNGKHCDSREILRANSQVEAVSDEDLTRNQYQQYEEDRTHLPYENELAWLQRVEEGKSLPKDFFSLGNKKIMDGVGIMSADNGTKQMEYLAVSAITLATRVAIKVGLPPFRMYQLSDLYLQRLSLSKSAIDMLEVCYNGIDAFSKEIRMYKKVHMINPYVEQSKDYIAKHIFEKITVKDIADNIGINRSHLSKLFSSQEKMTLNAYLMGEKLKAAKNLLVYSDRSVAEIAEYLNFSSASHFGQQFKEHFQMTPRHYRIDHKTKEFSENTQI